VIAVLERHVEIVENRDDGVVVRHEVACQVEQPELIVHVQVGRRLVEEKHPMAGGRA